MGFWKKIGDSFGKNGTVTRFCEKLPVIGHATAGIQALAGNKEEAKRALATSTNGLITAAGAAAGFAVGGPAGAVAGGALASAAGIGVEYGISKTIKDADVAKDCGDISASRFAKDMLFNGAGAMLGGGGAASSITKSFGAAAEKQFVTETVKLLGGSAVKTGLAVTATSSLANSMNVTFTKDFPFGKPFGDVAIPVPDGKDEDPDEKLSLVTANQERAATELRTALLPVIQARVPVLNGRSQPAVQCICDDLRKGIAGIITGREFHAANGVYRAADLVFKTRWAQAGGMSCVIDPWSLGLENKKDDYFYWEGLGAQILEKDDQLSLAMA